MRTEKTISILKQCKDLTLSEISEIRESLGDIYREIFDNTFEVIRVYPYYRIEEQIKSETGFHCYYEYKEGYTMGRGAHVIMIPKEKYSEELKKELIDKYEPKYTK